MLSCSDFTQKRLLNLTRLVEKMIIYVSAKFNAEKKQRNDFVKGKMRENGKHCTHKYSWKNAFYEFIFHKISAE